MNYLINYYKKFSSSSLTKKAALLMLVTGIVISLWILIFGGYLVGKPLPDPDKAKDLQPFITALVTPLLTLGSTLLVLENLRATSIQNFSNNFFKLIDQHHKLVDNISTTVDSISTSRNPSKGSAFFDDLAERIACDYYYCGKLPKAKRKKDQIQCPYGFQPSDALQLDDLKAHERLIEIYDHYFHIHNSDLGHYFRNLYHIVRFVERSSLRLEIQIQYVKILRAQLSNYEILLLSYNGLHPFGKKFYTLIERFELLKNLNTEDGLPDDRSKRIIDVQILKDGYPHFKKYQEEY